MPFTKIKRGRNRGKYRSPSGRVFTRKQVRRYYARGGSFDASDISYRSRSPVGSGNRGLGAGGGRSLLFDQQRSRDVQSGGGDPTGTRRTRHAWARDFGTRWARFNAIIRATVIDNDVFGLSVETPMSIQMMTASGTKVLAFQAWVDASLAATVLGTDRGQWFKTWLDQGYAKGVQHAAGKLSEDVTGRMGRTDVLSVSAYVELQGIAEAVSQQMVRAFGDGQLMQSKAGPVGRALIAVVNKVGARRTEQLAGFYTVRAHAMGTLDALEDAGAQMVGIIPEHVHRRQPLVQDYDPDQPRRPKGDPEGGQWTSAGSGASEEEEAEAQASVKDHEDLASKSLRRPLTNDEKDALASYSEGDWEELNDYLRAGGTKKFNSELSDTLKGLDSAFKKASLAKDLVVYRTISSDVYDGIVNNVGGLFHDAGFVSTTDQRSAASVTDVRKLVEVFIPKGSAALPIAHLSTFKSEREVLINRRALFQVEKTAAGAIRLTLQKPYVKP